MKVWSLINCIANKIAKIKQIEIGSTLLADNLNDLNRISDELSDSLDWIEGELPGRTAINKQTNSFKQKLNYWMRIMNEFKLLRSAKIRQKEIKKVKILLGFGKLQKNHGADRDNKIKHMTTRPLSKKSSLVNAKKSTWHIRNQM